MLLKGHELYKRWANEKALSFPHAIHVHRAACWTSNVRVRTDFGMLYGEFQHSRLKSAESTWLSYVDVKGGCYRTARTHRCTKSTTIYVYIDVHIYIYIYLDVCVYVCERAYICISARNNVMCVYFQMHSSCQL